MSLPWLRRGCTLRRRFRTKRDRQYLGAFSELLSNAAFVAGGYDTEALEVGGQTPDLRVRGGRHAFIAETTTTHDVDRDQLAAERRAAGVLRALHGIDHRDFVVQAVATRRGDHEPSPRRARGLVLAWLEGLDYSAVASDREGLAATQSTFDVGEWVFTVYARAKHAADRTPTARRCVCPLSPLVRVSVGRTSLSPRSAVMGKRRMYDGLGEPLVVVVNHFGSRVDLEAAVDICFGHRVLRFPLGGEGDPVEVFVWDGLFAEDRNRGVAAVLLLDNISPWDLWVRSAFLVHNPHAEQPLPSLRVPGAHVIHGDGRVVEGEGPFGAALGLEPPPL